VVRLGYYITKLTQMSLINKIVPLFMLPVGMNRYEINVKFLGLEIDKYIDWKTHIECFTQNEEMRAI